GLPAGAVRLDLPAELLAGDGALGVQERVIAIQLERGVDPLERTLPITGLPVLPDQAEVRGETPGLELDGAPVVLARRPAVAARLLEEAEQALILRYGRETRGGGPRLAERIVVLALKEEAVDPLAARPVPEDGIVDHGLELPRCVGGAPRLHPQKPLAQARRSHPGIDLEGARKRPLCLDQSRAPETEEPDEGERIGLGPVSLQRRAQQCLGFLWSRAADERDRAPEGRVRGLGRSRAG